jgi:hypothetical protein
MARSWEARRWAVTEWRSDYANRLELTWPAPPWSTFWEHDLFLGFWGRSLDGLFKGSRPHDDALLAQLVFAWVDAATAVVAWAAPVGLPGASVPDWAGLVRQLEGLIPWTGLLEARPRLVRDWLISVASLLMPEMIGPRPEITGPFAKSAELKKFWGSAATDIQQVRNGPLASFVSGGMEELGKGLRARIPDDFPPELGS